MPTPATVLLSAPVGCPVAAELRGRAAAAGFAVADHVLGSAPAIDFGPVAVAVVSVGARPEAAAAQVRRWRAELGDTAVPVLWAGAPEQLAAGLDAGADAAVALPVEPEVFAGQLRTLARARVIAARVAARAAEARLVGDQLKRTLAQLDREAEMARRVRAGFLPRALPEVGGVRFHAHHRARARAGGDFHDVRRLDENHVGFFIGEVVGTGGAGGLLGVYVQQSAILKEITGHTYRLVPPQEVLAGVNRRLAELDADDLPLVAMLCGLLNAQTGELTLARAGLPPPVYVPHDGPAAVWTVPGPFLGAAGATYPPLTTTLRPGDRLLVGTDGTRPDGDPGPGSPDHLLAAAERHRGATGPAFVDAVAGELLRHVRHGDDFTLLGVEVIV